MKKVKKGRINSILIVLSVISVLLPIFSTSVSTKAAEPEKGTGTDVIELESAEVLASVDFSGTEGVFNSGDGSTTLFDLTDPQLCTDPLTAKEVKGIEKTYSVVFRAKTAGIGLREQAVFSMRFDDTDKSKFDKGLYIGIPGKYNAPAGTAAGSETFYYKCQNTGTLLSENPVTIVRSSTEETSGIIDDTWHIVAIVQDIDNIKFYVDGQLYYEPAVAVKMSYPLSRIFGMVEDGKFTAYIDYFNCTQETAEKSKFKGSMDYYQFYKGALTANEVAAISQKSADATVGIDGRMPETAPKTATVEAFTADEFAAYRTEKDKKERYTQAPAKTGCIFGGWYLDNACKRAVDESSTLLSQETVYAKFIPKHVLDAKAQVSVNLLDNDFENDNKGAIRFSSTVDSGYYGKVGFHFQFLNEDGNPLYNGYERESSKVYRKIYLVDGEGNSGVDQRTPKEAFVSASEYFFSYSFYDLKRVQDYDVVIKVKAFWETLDGTVVYGEETTKRVNQGRTKSWVFLSGNSNRVEAYGNMVTPYTTWKEAVTAATSTASANGVVCVLDNYEVQGSDVCSTYGKDKHVTITSYKGDTVDAESRKKLKFAGETLYTSTANTTAESFKGINIKGETTFSGITLDIPTNTHVYANGYEFKVDEDVTTMNPIQVYGGKHRDNPKKDTKIILLGGDYSRVYGGSYHGGVTGSTYVKVAGNANKDMTFATDGTMSVGIYGGSYGSNIAGSTEVIVGGNVNYSLDLANVSQYKYGGAEVFGGCHTRGIVKGNTSVTIEDNAKVTLVGGGGNGKSIEDLKGCTLVLGNANVTVKGNVNEGLDTSLSEKYVVLYGGARYGAVGGGNENLNDLSATKSAAINVTVETQNGKTPRFNYIYGGGVYERSNYDDKTTHDYIVDTNVTINAWDNDARVCRAVYGGSEKYLNKGDGQIRDTSVVIKGGKMLEVIGGSEIVEPKPKNGKTDEVTAITGNTDVKLLGGKITGRVHGGCDNEREYPAGQSAIWGTQSLVGGWASLSIEPEVILSFQETVNANSSKDNHYIIAGSCGANETENSVLICNRDTYDSCAGKLGRYVTDTVPYKYIVDIMGDGEASFDASTGKVVIKPDDASVVTKLNRNPLTGMSSDNTYTCDLVDEVMQVTFNHIELSNWKLRGIPECKGEATELSEVYDCGSIINDFGTSASAKMQWVYNIKYDEVTDYATNVLQAAGYKKERVNDTSVSPNRFLRYTKGMKTVYINHYGASNKAMIILDPNAHLKASDASYTTYTAAGDGTAYYMFGMNKTGLTSGNGQTLVIRSADNKIIIVDGGVWTGQMEYDYVDFLKFLRDITGKQDGEKIDVSAWVITHFHNDHVRGFAELLTETYRENFNIERVISNMPKLENVTEHSSIYNDCKAVYNEIKDISAKNSAFMDVKVHTGDVIQLADVKLRFLYTHEDSVDSGGVAQIENDFNNTGTVFMVESEGMKMLVTGDISTAAERAMFANYPEKLRSQTFECNIVQTPHHCLNKMDKLYAYTKPEILFFTCSAGKILGNTEMKKAYKDTVEKCAHVKEYFDDLTVGVKYNPVTKKVERSYLEDESRSDDAKSLLSKMQ